MSDRTHPTRREALYRYLCTCRDIAMSRKLKRYDLHLELGEIERLIELVKADNIREYEEHERNNEPDRDEA